ncbi:ORF3 [Nidovirales sp.]|nr:ORF3 [Nidovirales sp.]
MSNGQSNFSRANFAGRSRARARGSFSNRGSRGRGFGGYVVQEQRENMQPRRSRSTSRQRNGQQSRSSSFNGSNANGRQRSVSNNRSRSFEFVEKIPQRLIRVPKYQNNQKNVHSASVVDFNAEFYSQDKNSTYTAQNLAFLCFFFSSYARVDGKAMAGKKPVTKSDLHTEVNRNMHAIVENFQKMPKISSTDNDFTSRCTELFETYLQWCHAHFKNSDGTHKNVFDVKGNQEWQGRRQNETTGDDAIQS